MNYWFKARAALQTMYLLQHLDLQKQGKADEATELLKERDSLGADVPAETPRTLEPLITAVKASKALKPPPEFLQELNDLDADLRFFVASGESELRRKINLDEAYPEP